jgi:hypothetical protein
VKYEVAIAFQRHFRKAGVTDIEQNILLLTGGGM